AKPAWSAYAPNIVRLLEALIASVQSISGAQANGGATSPRHADVESNGIPSWRHKPSLFANATQSRHLAARGPADRDVPPFMQRGWSPRGDRPRPSSSLAAAV